MILVVLASGRGKRLENLTKQKPKCLINISNKFTLLDGISRNFKFFKKVVIVTGYKNHLIEKKLNFKNLVFIKNKKYFNTNMVESLFLTKNEIKNEDILITYADIFFDTKILINLIKIKKNIIPLKKNWYQSWKARYKSLTKIKKDAENVIVRKKKILSIGGKIKKKLPKFQYMGIVRINNSTFKKMHKFYKVLGMKNISFTHFIDKLIQNKVAEFNFLSTERFWYEVDNKKDLTYLKKNINDHLSLAKKATLV